MHPLLEALSKRSWHIDPVESPIAQPAAIAERYPALQSGLLDLLSRVGNCVRHDGQSWLLTFNHFEVNPSEGFRWNEYELMALESAVTERERTAIKRFWDHHFPFLLAVHSDYDYLAIELSSGHVVHGFAPEWEQPSTLATSFDAFVQRVSAESALAELSYPLSVLL